MLTSYKFWSLGEVRDEIAYDTRFEVSPTGMCSFSEGLGINSQSSDIENLAATVLW